jgi:transposase-like protein
MDTVVGSEPGGVGWKDVHVGRLRTDYKRQAVDLVKSSGPSVGLVPEELGLRKHSKAQKTWVRTARRDLSRPPRADSPGAGTHLSSSLIAKSNIRKVHVINGNVSVVVVPLSVLS